MYDKSTRAIQLSLKYFAADYGISGVTVVFIKALENGVLGVDSVNVIGEDLYSADMPSGAAGLFSYIMKCKKKFDTVPTNEKKIHDAVLSELRENIVSEIKSKIEARDTGSVVFEMKKIIAGAISSEDMKIQGDISEIDINDYYIINANERLEGFTASHKIDIAKKYTRDAQLAQTIIRDASANVTVARFLARECAAVVFVENNRKAAVAFCAASDPELIQSLDIKMHALPFYKAVLAKSPNDRCNDIISKANISKLSEAVASGDASAAAECLKSVFASGAVDASFQCALDSFNCLVLDVAFSPVFPAAKEGEHGEEKNVRKTIDVSLVLSPMKGKKLSELLPGSSINVILDQNSPIGMKFIKNLNLMDDKGKVAPISAEVYGIKRDVKNGFTVYTKITSDLYGKSYEEQDVMVKAGNPVYDDAGESSSSSSSSSSRSMIIGVIAGVVVIIAIIAAVIFLK